MMRMVANIRKLRWLLFFAFSLAALCFAPSAAAGSITLNLNCEISGGTACAGTGDWGTVTLSDTAEGNILINLVFTPLTGSGWKLLSYDFNYDDSKFSNSSVFALASGITVEVKENSQVLQGSGNFGGFDLEVPKHGNIGAIGSYTDLLSWSGGTLDLDDFFLPNSGGIYFGVHIGNYMGGATASIGASTGPGETSMASVTPVPEPASLLLLGAGLASLSVLARRKGR